MVLMNSVLEQQSANDDRNFYNASFRWISPKYNTVIKNSIKYVIVNKNYNCPHYYNLAHKHDTSITPPGPRLLWHLLHSLSQYYERSVILDIHIRFNTSPKTIKGLLNSSIKPYNFCLVLFKIYFLYFSHTFSLILLIFKDLDDGDLEGLLSKLSAEELEDLNNDFDPDNSMLPPSQRCRDQTTKAPTGPFKREQLLKFLEDQAKNEKDWEDVMPFSPGVKRGKVWEGDSGRESGEDSGEGGVLGTLSRMEMPIELDIDDDDDDDDDELDENKKFAYKIYNQFSSRIEVKKIITSRLEADDEDMKEVNINNMKRVSKEKIRALITAACASKHITKLTMANTAITDSEARGLVELLETSPSLKVLNIESNFITPELLAKLLRATLTTQSLVEFHAENQRQSVLGNQIEMDMMLSVEDNDSLLRVGVAFQSMEARHRVSEALERNYERC
uniref:Tropomodulin n=1 Tax=Heterorhabditis bacteriophora TaxID=37862 RepID=A0A1I7WB38_HETBA